jgi:hypothetical protein
MISWLNAIALFLMAAGIVMAFAGRQILRWAPPGIGPAWQAVHGTRGEVSPAAHAGPQPGHLIARPMARSIPVSLAIPGIKVRARIFPAGLNPSGAISVPARTATATSWYDAAAAPGQRGTAVLLGRVSAASAGPAAFSHLSRLRPGSRVYVALRDHRVAVFLVSSVTRYLTAAFPAKVFDPTRRPSLRLIACGGKISKNSGQCPRKTVAFATYAGQGGSRLASG